jgi:hypothetical protein
MAKKLTTNNTQQLRFAFTRKNYQLLLMGIGILLIGYLLMMGGGSEDPNVFSEEIFSFRRITLAPFVVLTGYAFVGYAIMYKDKSSQTIQQSK